MAIASSIELIWHFAGYLHLTQDYVASRIRLDEISHHYRQSDFRLSADEHIARTEGPSDMTSFAVRVKYNPGSENLAHVKWADLPEYDPLAVSAPNFGIDQSLPHFLSAGVEALSIGKNYIVHYVAEPHGSSATPPEAEATAPAYEIKYDGGGDDTIANLSQTNIGNDRDYFTDGSTEIGTLDHVNIDQPMADMLALADEHNPTMALPPGESIEFWTSMIVNRQDSIAAGETEAQPLAPGRYVNGEVVPEDQATQPETAFTNVVPEPPVRAEDSIDPAQIAETGGNKLINSGTLIDVDEAPSTLVVVGDYYETNAILQTNVLQNHDVVFHSGETPELTDSAGSTLDNVANFVIEELVGQRGHHHGPVGNLTVNIDYVDGDVMDVKSLTQRNYFDDGDVSVQTRFDSYSEIHTGDNTQANVARFADWGKHYDVIIVVGDYYSGNIISQTNVILDNDLIGISSTADNSSSICTGQNALENEATIAKYGATTFNDIDRKLESLIDDLNHQDDLDHNAWSDFYGASSGSLNVLFVTGNYYDLNIISQINVLADADLAIQMGSSGIQWLSTGGNSAINEATIVNAGGIYDQRIGGDFYEDSILVQADLMSDAHETIATDPTALVSELVAFMDHSPDHDGSDTIAWTKDIFGHGDTFGHVLS
jgi:hypothetical protein